MKCITPALKYLCAGLLLVFSLRAGFGAYPSGIPVTPYLIGQNDWYQTPDSAWPTVKNSGVALVRIGGHAFDVTPQSDAWLLQQVDRIRGIGAEPLIQVSRFASLQTAIATVTYINVTNARHVKYWSIGNEPDLNYPGTDTQLAADVATYIKQIAPAMRDVDPSITIVAPDLAFYGSTKINELLGGGSDITGKDSSGRYYIDCVSFHRYGSTSFTTADALNDMHTGFEANRVAPLVNRIAYANSLQGRTGASALTWALTEFNITTSNPANNTPAGYGVSSFLNGQFFAEYYRVAMKRGVALMSTWSMLEGGGNGSAGDLGFLGGTWSAPVPRSSYYHMQMIANYLLPGGYLDGSSSSANVGVLSTSSATQASIAVMLLNEDTFDHTFSLRLDSGSVLGVGDTRINVAANLAAEYSGTIGQQSTVVLVFDAAGGLLKRVTYSLALYSSNATPVVEIFNAAAAPVFSPPAGTYASAQSVAISTTTPSASIRYTTDGSTPTSSTGTLYSGPVTITAGATLQAVAYSADFSASGVTTGAYTIGTSLPSGPTAVSATAVSTTQINLSWSAGVGATDYDVKRSTASGGPYATIATGVPSTSFVDSGLNANTAYYYVVSGNNANGASPNSREVNATTFTPALGTTAAFEAESLPFTPNGVTATVNPDSGASGGNWVQLNSTAPGQYLEFTTGSIAAGAYDLQLTFKANNNRGQLNLTVDDVLIGSLDQYAATPTFPTTTVGSVTFNTAATHRLRLTVSGKAAASSGYLLSADRFLFLAHANQVSATPTGLTATSGDGRVGLNWTAAPGAASHLVKRATTTDGPYTTVAAGIVTPTFTDSSVTNGATYYYVVSAVNAFGESANSFEVRGTPRAGTPSLAFEAENLTVTASGSSISVNTDTGASGGKWIQLNSSAAGPAMTFTTGSVPAGAYTLQLTYKANNNRGQLSVAVDGVLVGGTLDEYAAASAFVTKNVGSVTFASTGTHTLKLTATGKNSASTGFILSADKFNFAGQTAATLTLGNLNPTYDGTAKTVSTTTTPAGLNVVVTYNGTSTAPTAAGAYAVLASISDPLYLGTASGTLVIAPAAASATLSHTTQVYDGSPKSVTATTSPADLPVNITYNGSPAVPTQAGNYLVAAIIDDPNYTGSASDTLTITPAVAAVTLGQLTQSYNGAPASVSATTSPADLSVKLTYDGSTNAPTNAGTYAVIATITDPNYAGSAAGTLILAPATPSITWGAPAAITYGAALDETQLNATASIGGTFAYSPAPGTVLNAGANQPLSVVFTPADLANYSAATAVTTITVNRANAPIALTAVAPTYDGTPKPVSAATTPAGLAVNISYDGNAVAPTNAGSYAINASITDANYFGSATGDLVIGKAPATITLGALSSTYDGTAKSATAVTTPAGLPVTLTYDGSSTAPTNAGSYLVGATINHANYSGGAGATLVIAKTTNATIALGPLRQVYDGTAKTVTAATTPSGLDVTLTYDGAAPAPTYPGAHAIVAAIDDPNYSVTKTDTLVITTAALVRHAPTLNGIVDGSVQVLLPESLTLNGSASLSGDLLVPGTPTLRLNGNPTLAGTKDGIGSATPTGHTITLNGSVVLRYLVRHVDAITLPTIVAPAAPGGTRNVTLNNPTDPVGSFATLRNLTLNSNVGPVAVPAGIYGSFTANGSSGFVLGTPDAIAPTIYQLQSLTLNGGSSLQVVGPVVVVLASGATINADCGTVDHPEWLDFEISAGGMTVNGNATVHGFVTAPAGTVTLNGSATLHGGVSSDRLTLNGHSLLSQSVP